MGKNLELEPLGDLPPPKKPNGAGARRPGGYRDSQLRGGGGDKSPRSQVSSASMPAANRGFKTPQ